MLRRPAAATVCGMTNDYDVIVVGARCAGSPTAMLLARRGHRVLVLDRATFPSDTLSTHVITPVGVAALDRWGLLDQVLATGCPPMETWSFDFGPLSLRGTPPPVDGHSTTYAPRRLVLDQLLVEAARAAGAEVREGVNVEEVLMDGDRAIGVRASGQTITARIVIGADGRNSHVARDVGATSSHEKPQLQYSYFTYFEELPVEGFEVFIRPHRGFAAAPTNDGQTMVVAGWRHAEATDYKADVERNFLETLESAPGLAERVHRARRVAPFLGGSLPGFVRTPFGCGWALVGDAACIKDAITAQGMSDAFVDADLVASGLDAHLRGEQPLEDALAPWLADKESRMPLYEFTAELASLAPPSPELQALIGAAAGNKAAMDGFAGVVSGTVSPAEYFSPASVGAILGAPVG
jgi:2-polyprenyl-6-methoxyphenol hydroxylase-like FAD-dependent oxidoreductase